MFFFFNDTATTEIYTLPLHAALPISMGPIPADNWLPLAPDGSSFGPEPAALADRFALLNSRFADAWRVTNKTSLFDYSPGTSTNDFTDRNWPPPLGQACNVPHATHRPPQG